MEYQRVDIFDDTYKFNEGVAFFPDCSSLRPATIILKAESTIRTDNRLADFCKALLIVKYGAVAGIRPFRRGNLGIELRGLARSHNQITAIDEFQFDLPPLPSLHHLAFADSVTALQTTQVAVGITRERFTGNFSNAGDDYGHDTSPA